MYTTIGACQTDAGITEKKICGRSHRNFALGNFFYAKDLQSHCTGIDTFKV